MADFIKPSNQILQNKTTTIDTTLAIPNEYGGIYDKPKKRKKGFVENGMNNDNFWNLMFALGMTLGWCVALGFGRQNPTAAFISSWITIIGVPLFVRHFSKITCTDGKFFNSEGIVLDIPKQLPNGFFLIITTVGVLALTAAVVDNFAKSHPASTNFIFVSILLIEFFFIPILFFICKNCPISILFNYQFYKQNVEFTSSPSFEDRKSSSYKSAKHDFPSTNSSSVHWSADPSKSYMPGNAYYNKR